MDENPVIQEDLQEISITIDPTELDLDLVGEIIPDIDNILDPTPRACHVCTLINPGTYLVCEACGSMLANTGYQCPFCLHNDELKREHCLACGQNISWAHKLQDDPSLLFSMPDSKVEVETFFCDICMENKDKTVVCHTICEHQYCQDCMVEYVTIEIEEARILHMCCPGINESNQEKCDAPFSHKDIIHILSKQEDQKKKDILLEKYDRFYKMKTNDNYVSCPKCNHLQQGSSLRPSMVCKRDGCEQEFCFRHSNAHIGSTCSEYITKTKKEFKEARKFIKETSITCPNILCRAKIFKTEGCNHMSCTQCGSNFCYLCGNYFLFGLHYHPKNIFGCPGQMFSDGRPNSRKTREKQMIQCIGYPFIFILLSVPICLILAAALIVESLWLILVIIGFPCIILLIRHVRKTQLVYDKDLRQVPDPRAMTNLKQIICVGPVLCGIGIRLCGFGVPRSCMKFKWLCPMQD